MTSSDEKQHSHSNVESRDDDDVIGVMATAGITSLCHVRLIDVKITSHHHHHHHLLLLLLYFEKKLTDAT